MISTDSSHRRIARLVFYLGLAVYITLHVGYLQYSVLRQRRAPIEPDDAYSYILKAPQLLECVEQECPALTDLRSQLQAPSTDHRTGGTSWIRSREYLRLFVPYHPLHSLLLLLIRAIGVSWESAYSAIWLVGSLFIAGAVACWLHALIGPGGAGIALGTLAFGHFQEQGLDAIVPSTLSMAIALTAWTLILVEKPKQDWWLPVLIVATSAMHSGGLLWSTVTVSAFVLFRFERAGHYYRVASSCMAAWVLGAIYVRYFPDLLGGGGHLYNPLSGDPVVLAELGKNVATAGRVAGAWVLSFGGGATQLAHRLPMPQVAVIGACLGALLVWLCLAGLRSLSPRRRYGVILLGTLIVGLTSVTMLYVVPGYPAPLFVRSWVFLAVLLTGLAAQGVWVLATQVISRQVPWSAMAVAASIGVLAAAILRMAWGVESLEVLRNSMATRSDLTFDMNQPRLLQQGASSGSAVLYLAEDPLYFYLTHGGNRFSAVYYPAVARTPEEARWIHQNTALQFVAGMSPAAGLVLGRGDTLAFAGGPPAARTFLLMLGPSRGSATLAWRSGDNRMTPTRQVVNLEGASWITVPVFPSLTLQVEDAPSQGVRIGGLKYDARDSSNWPWGLGTELSVTRADGATPGTIRFDLDREIPIPHRGADIVGDQGDTFLVRVHR